MPCGRIWEVEMPPTPEIKEAVEAAVMAAAFMDELTKISAARPAVGIALAPAPKGMPRPELKVTPEIPEVKLKEPKILKEKPPAPKLRRPVVVRPSFEVSKGKKLRVKAKAVRGKVRPSKAKAKAKVRAKKAAAKLPVTKPEAKQALKNALVIAGGTAVGTGVGIGAGRMFERWASKMTPRKARVLKVLLPILGGGGGGLMGAAYALSEKEKAKAAKKLLAKARGAKT